MIARVSITIALLVSIASALEVSDEAKAIVNECRTTYNIEIDQIKSGIENKKLPETENGKCFVECVMEKGGVLADGKLNVDRAKELNAKKLAEKPDIKEKADQVIDACKDVAKPEEKCEYGVAITKCVIEHSEKLGIPAPQFNH
uniref:Odorant-binding protein 10 n=1 Tax=Tropidothorax elegans TaxID=2233830 RepID=A0A2Z5EM80_9HEMI|nr:odorant-binding protein 10 [Tropidothorax elegans]